MSPNPNAVCAYWPNSAVAIARVLRPLARPVWLGLLMMLLAVVGCSQRLPLPSEQPRLTLPMQLLVSERDGTRTQQRILVIQQEGAALRWSLLSPMGMPLARQRLVDGQWRADGLLPPNAQARELFAALLFALTPADQLERLYPSHAAHPQNGERALITGRNTLWRVRYTGPGRFDLDVGEVLTYGVAPLAAPDGAIQP